ncbi:type III secretion system translocon subunit SctE [Martelella alba]|uniref:Uncharacterized protein n=1 Tax=Martelella alba TaxID=2590451 RepID=A0ABY2SIM8_9HYPH|nr:type III secretion system translocon subunit SctE [Martelella alba]TKI05075.1 hypothetical protein FCN80_15315 [Martelella alba]
MTDSIGTIGTGHGEAFAQSARPSVTEHAGVDKPLISQAKAQSLYDEAQKAARDMLTLLSDTPARTAVAVWTANDAPELAPPRSSAQGDDKWGNTARFTQLAGNAMRLLGNASLSQLASRLEVMMANSHALQQRNEALYMQFQQAAEHSTAATAQAEADLASLDAAAQQLADKQQAYDQAKLALSQLAPQDPGYEAAYGQLQTAELALNQAREQWGKAESLAQQSYAAAREAVLAVDDLLIRLESLVNAQGMLIKQTGEQNLNALARMLLLIGTFIKLVGENSEKALENDSALFQSMQETRQKEMQRKAEEYDAEVRKAEQLNKAMGCVGKILGGLITALSVIGAVFSGGASLAFAAVGLALLVGDEISKAVSGVSFMEKALSPIMENIIKPLVDALSKGIAKMLERLGMDANTAAMIGGIVGTLVAAALIIAVVIVGKAAAGKAAASAFGNLINDAIRKLIPNILKDMAGKSSALVSDSIKRLLSKLSLRSDSLALKSYTNRLNSINTGAGISAETAQAGGRVAQGIYERNAQTILASFTLSNAEMEQVRQLLEQMVEKFSDAQSSQQQQWASLIELQNAAAQANKTIVRNALA